MQSPPSRHLCQSVTLLYNRLKSTNHISPQFQKCVDTSDMRIINHFILYPNTCALSLSFRLHYVISIILCESMARTPTWDCRLIKIYGHGWKEPERDHSVLTDKLVESKSVIACIFDVALVPLSNAAQWRSVIGTKTIGQSWLFVHDLLHSW